MFFNDRYRLINIYPLNFQCINILSTTCEYYSIVYCHHVEHLLLKTQKSVRHDGNTHRVSLKPRVNDFVIPMHQWASFKWPNINDFNQEPKNEKFA